MSLQRTGVIVLVAGIALLVLRSVISTDVGRDPSARADPAIEFYTKDRSASYGGIDRWAYYGMKKEAFVARISKDGYDCQSPQDSEAGANSRSVHELVCNKQARWPLSRSLLIRASINNDMRGRLVRANASSSLTTNAYTVSRHMADFLRKLGWIEPEHLQIRGFEIDAIDTMTRLAVDALASGSWHEKCEQNLVAPNCAELAQKRRTSGYPALPQGAVAVGNAMNIHAAMERIRFMPLVPRYADNKPADSLIVRVSNEQMWLDFVSKDLVGRELMVSISLDSEGGAPTRLVAKLGAESRVVTLAGASRRANNRAVKYLVPESGTKNPRFSIWLDLPNKDYPVTFQRLAHVLPNTDPAFVARIVRAVIASISATSQPEEALGLYPELRSIELRADLLREAQAERWLPPEQSVQLVKQAYQEDPVTRAAWALAMCESATKPPVMDEVCWLRFTASDKNAADLMRSEVANLQTLYAELEPTHPLRLRMKRLSDVLPPD